MQADFHTGPSTDRPGYRMLAAILATDGYGQYFVKLYGPAKTIANAKDAFRTFIDSLKVDGKKTPLPSSAAGP